MRLLGPLGFVLVCLLSLAAFGPALADEPKGIARVDANGDPLPPGVLARIGSLRLLHGGRITGLAFSNDGKMVISLSSDFQARAWSVKDGKEIALPPRAVSGKGLAVSPRGRFLAIQERGKFSLVDLTNDQVVWTNEPPDHAIAVAISHDEKWLARVTNSQPPSVHLHDLATGKEVRLCKIPGQNNRDMLPRGPAMFRHLTFSNDGKMLAGLGDFGVLLWDVGTGSALRRYTSALDNPSVIGGVAFSADGKWLFGTPGDNLLCWSTSSLDERYGIQCQQGSTFGVAVSRDGMRVATGGSDGSIGLWDAANGKAISKLQPPGNETIQAVAFSPDGKMVVSGDDRGMLRLWDAETGMAIAEPNSREPFLAAGFTPDGKEVLTVGTNGLGRWSATTGKAAKALPAWEGGRPNIGEFSSDGKSVAVLFEMREIGIFDTTTGKQRFATRIEVGPQCSFCFNPTGTMLALDDTRQKKIQVVDARNGRTRLTFKANREARRDDMPWPIPPIPPGPGPIPVDDFIPEPMLRVAYSPDGRTLYATGYSPKLQRWEVITGKERPIVTLPVAPRPNDPEACFSPDGTTIAIPQENRVVLADLQTGESLRTLDTGEGALGFATFSPDGKLLAAGGHDGNVYFWNVASGKRLAVRSGHRGMVRDVRFSRDGKRLLSMALDSTLMIWDVSEATRPVANVAIVTKVRPPETLWADLGSDDAAVADRAAREMLLSQQAVLPLLSKNLQPVPPVPERTLTKLIEGLDADTRDARDQADKQLASLGELAVSALEKARDSGSAEVKRRANKLLERLEQPVGTGLEARPIRAMEVLERMSSPLARKLLEDLSRGAADARLTKEAGAALRRVTLRQQDEP